MAKTFIIFLQLITTVSLLYTVENSTLKALDSIGLNTEFAEYQGSIYIRKKQNLYTTYQDADFPSPINIMDTPSGLMFEYNFNPDVYIRIAKQRALNTLLSPFEAITDSNFWLIVMAYSSLYLIQYTTALAKTGEPGAAAAYVNQLWDTFNKYYQFWQTVKDNKYMIARNLYSQQIKEIETKKINNVPPEDTALKGVSGALDNAISEIEKLSYEQNLEEKAESYDKKKKLALALFEILNGKKENDSLYKKALVIKECLGYNFYKGFYEGKEILASFSINPNKNFIKHEAMLLSEALSSTGITSYDLVEVDTQKQSSSYKKIEYPIIKLKEKLFPNNSSVTYSQVLKKAAEKNIILVSSLTLKLVFENKVLYDLLLDAIETFMIESGFNISRKEIETKIKGE